MIRCVLMAIYAMCSSDEWILVYCMLMLLHFPTALLPEYSTGVSVELFIRLVLGLWGKIIRLRFASNSFGTTGLGLS